MTPLATIHSCLLALAMLFLPSQVFAQTTKSSWQEDWGKSLEAARSQVENQSEDMLEKRQRRGFSRSKFLIGRFTGNCL